MKGGYPSRFYRELVGKCGKFMTGIDSNGSIRTRSQEP